MAGEWCDRSGNSIQDFIRGRVERAERVWHEFCIAVMGVDRFA